MQPGQPAVLQFPALLHGPLSFVEREAKREGRRCAEYYHQHGCFPLPLDLREVQPGEVVMTHVSPDFFREKPAWRLYHFLKVITGFDEAVDQQDWRQMDAAFERFCHETPWGALYHAVEPSGPTSVERMAPRLAAVLRSWDSLLVPRYLYKQLQVFYTLDELMEELYGCTMVAWSPRGPCSVREHIEVTVERMARASKEDCLHAVLRVIPYILSGPFKLKHRDVLGDPALQLKRLNALSPDRFERISSAYLPSVYSQLLTWDRELAMQ